MVLDVLLLVTGGGKSSVRAAIERELCPVVECADQAFAEWMRRHAADPLHMPHVLTTGGWDEMRWDRLTSLRSSWSTHLIDTSMMTRTAVAEAVLA